MVWTPSWSGLGVRQSGLVPSNFSTLFYRTISMAQARRRQFCYDFPRPAVTVDVIIFTIRDDDLKVLLIRRGREPFQGRWAIPGGFVDMNEPLEEAARRELQEETGVRDVLLEQLAAFGDPHRDPRGWVISIAYFVLLNAASLTIQAADDAADVGWFSMSALPPLAFDHDKILACALKQLRSKLAWAPVGVHLLPKKFTLAELQRVHEAILGRRLEPRRFRRQVLSRGIVEELRETRRASSHRPVRLYRFRKMETDESGV